MNTRSLKLIRDVMINSGKVTSIEISQDSMYLEFKNVELGNPKSNEEMSLTVRFAEDSFFTVFYNNIWDVDFMSKYDYKKQLLSQEISFDIKEIKFIDFEYLNTFFLKAKNQFPVLKTSAFTISAMTFSCWSTQRKSDLLLAETRWIFSLHSKGLTMRH